MNAKQLQTMTRCCRRGCKKTRAAGSRYCPGCGAVLSRLSPEIAAEEAAAAARRARPKRGD